MKSFKLFIPITIFVFGFGILFSCKKKEDAKKNEASNAAAVACNGTASTYNSNIKAIISANCVSCHASYASYNGLRGSLNDGSFAREVLERQTMPKNTRLSSEQLSAIQCWKERGYPEN